MNVDYLLNEFYFNKYHYGVAFEELQSNWFIRFLTWQKTWKRYWIYQLEKSEKVGSKKAIKVLCKHRDIWDKTYVYFIEPSKVRDRISIYYFYNQDEPVKLIELLKSKLDNDSLKDHTIFNTEDLGW